MCQKCALGSDGAPNARAETGGPGTGPRPAAPKPIEPPDPMSDPRASHCSHPDLARAGNTPAQLNRVKGERSTSGINLAAAYSHTNRDFSAMAARSHGDHAPFSVELDRICRPDGPDDCEDGRQSEDAPTMSNHRSSHTVSVCTHPKGKALSNRHSPADRAMLARLKASGPVQKQNDRFDCGVCEFAPISCRQCVSKPGPREPLSTS